MKTAMKLVTVLVPLIFAQLGCAPGGGGEDPSCEGGKCDDLDDVPASACDGMIVDASGRNLGERVASRLNDPVAKAVLKPGDSCPTTYADVMAKLRENDKTGCEQGGRTGIQAMVVSERSQAVGQADGFRVVATRACNNRPQQAVFFSLFGMQAGGPLPEDVEVMALDESKGIYNYYAIEQGQWKYFGDSSDFLSGAGSGEERRCAGCHTGGGPIMKELDTPWLHWEGHTDTPGAAELVQAHENLGSKSSGASLEGLVKAGNRTWNQARVPFAKKNLDTKKMLEPLFCTVQVNVDNGADFSSPVTGGAGGDDLRAIPFDFLLDPTLAGFGSVSIVFADYAAQLTAIGQRVVGPGNRQLTTKDGAPVVDTIFDFVFPERSFEDTDYVGKLKEAGIIDDDFIKDVLMVDFTRPIFSTDRCTLLEFAPQLDEAGRTPAAIRDGFIANLQASSPVPGSAEAQLLANLTAQGDAQAHTAKVTAFTTACNGRNKAELIADVMRIASLRRNQARQRTVFEFSESMPVDNLSVDPATRLDSTSCALTTSLPQ